jgi:hypothetical protein
MARSPLMKEGDRSLAFWAAKGLPPRACHVVHFEGCRTMADVRQLGQAHFEQVRNCGQTTLQQIGAVIGGWGEAQGTDQEPRPLWLKVGRRRPAS